MAWINGYGAFSEIEDMVHGGIVFFGKNRTKEATALDSPKGQPSDVAFIVLEGGAANNHTAAETVSTNACDKG